MCVPEHGHKLGSVQVREIVNSGVCMLMIILLHGSSTLLKSQSNKAMMLASCSQPQYAALLVLIDTMHSLMFAGVYSLESNKA